MGKKNAVYRQYTRHISAFSSWPYSSGQKVLLKVSILQRWRRNLWEKEGEDVKRFLNGYIFRSGQKTGSNSAILRGVKLI